MTECKCGHSGEIHMNLRTNKTNTGRCLVDLGINHRCECMKFRPRKLLDYYKIGLALLIPSTLIGISVLWLNQYLVNGIWLPIPLLHFSIINGTVWIVGIILTIKGISKNNHRKRNEKDRRNRNRADFEANQNKEIQELKEKVESLEKDKEKNK